MAQIPIQTVNGSATPTFYSAAASDAFAADDQAILWLINSGGSARTVTFDSTQVCSAGVDHNPVITVPATSQVVVSLPFIPQRFGSNVTMTPDATTLLTFALFKLAAA